MAEPRGFRYLPGNLDLVKRFPLFRYPPGRPGLVVFSLVLLSAGPPGLSNFSFVSLSAGLPGLSIFFFLRFVIRRAART